MLWQCIGRVVKLKDRGCVPANGFVDSARISPYWKSQIIVSMRSRRVHIGHGEVNSGKAKVAQGGFLIESIENV